MKAIESILQSATRLPPFPAVIQRVLQLVEDPKSSARNVVEAIQYDQALTANILRVCNSAYFGARRPLYSVQDALVRIGFQQLLEIVLSYGSAFLFSRACRGYDMAEGDLWRHSVACALVSQNLAQRLQREKTSICFTAALLHDVGKIVLNEYVGENWTAIRKLVQEDGLSFLEAEREVLGIDHAEMGGRISEQWQFPPTLVVGIRYHHSPGEAPADGGLVSLVYLGDVVAMMTGIGGGADGLAYHGHTEIMRKLGLSGHDVERMVAQLQEQLRKIEILLNLVPKESAA